MSDDAQNTIGRKVKTARAKLAWRQKELAEKTGVSVASIVKFERTNKIRNTSKYAILYVLQKHGAPVDDDDAVIE